MNGNVLFVVLLCIFCETGRYCSRYAAFITGEDHEITWQPQLVVEQEMLWTVF